MNDNPNFPTEKKTEAQKQTEHTPEAGFEETTKSDAAPETTGWAALLEEDTPDLYSRTVSPGKARHLAENDAEPRKPHSSRKKNLLNILLCLFIGVFAVSGGVLLYQLVIEPAINRSAVSKYQDIYASASSTAKPASSEMTASVPSGAESEPGDHAGTFENVLDKFRPLLEANKDTAGWLTIEGTDLNHPVFYTPDDQNYYLKRDPDGIDNKYGSLFLSVGSTLNPQAQVMVMYGHNMEQDDLMFGQLNKFKSLSFLQAHPSFTFDTIYSEGTWKIIAVCRASTAELDTFHYSGTYYDTAESFDAFVKQARIRSMYRIDDDVNYNDSLVVLSTCDYYFYGDRLVVVARKLRDGETADAVNTDGYEINDTMLWPNQYYGLPYATSTRPTDEQIEQAYQAYYGN